MAGELDRPRVAPRSGKARQLVVFLHGYGADGNDLIELGRVWQSLLPDAAFVSPHAGELCAQTATGRQWFSLTFRDPNERWTGVNKAAPAWKAFLDAELKRNELPPTRAGSGRLQPGHHDGAACRAAAESGAGAIVGYSGLFVLPNGAKPEAVTGETSRGRRCCSFTATATTSSRRRRYFCRRSTLRRSTFRPNGISPPSSATASTRKACATAASFWRKRFTGLRRQDRTRSAENIAVRCGMGC